MGASAYVGRVGGLAIALGVGAAVASGHGIAWADETDSNSPTAEHSAPAGSPNADAVASTASGDPADSSDQTGAAGAAGADDENGADGEDGEDSDAADDADAAADVDDADTDDADVDDADVDDDEDADAAGDTDADAADDDAADDEDLADESAIDASGEAETTVETADDDTTGDDRSAGHSARGAARLAAVPSDDDADTFDAAGDITAGDDETDAHVQLSSATESTYQMQSLATTVQDIDPVPTAAPQAPSVQGVLQRVVVDMLSGLGALAANLPGAPTWSPFVMAVLGLASRREFTEPVTALTKTVDSIPAAASTLTNLATAAVTSFPGTTRKPVAVSANTAWIEFVTGAGNLNNTTTRFGIGGTDLGIMWDNGIKDNPATTGVDEHQVLIAFGDTFSNTTPVRTGVWRFNTLFRTADDVLSNGLYVPNGAPVSHLVSTPNLAFFSGSPMEKSNWADPILPSPGDAVHPPYAIGPEVTIIPTAGISTPYNNAYGARQYMSFMSVRSWDTPGRWTTNYSGIAYSDNNGQTWTIAPTSVRAAAPGRSTATYISGNQNFQQGAFVKPPAGSADAAQGWVYSYGTPSGRAGTVYLSRAKEDQLLDATKYEYWNGSTWVANKPSAATPILPGTTTSFFGWFPTTTYPSASEMSVQYNPYLKKYVMLYGDSGNNIVMRTADSPQGTWSAPKQLVSSWTMPGQYAPYVHPWSGTDNLSASEQQYLYWNLSTWDNYQVRLMRTDLTKV